MHGTMRVLDPSGHTEHHWDADVPVEVENARAQFVEMTGKGYQAFRMNMEGEKASRMTTFDPQAEAMILMPQLSGG